MADSLMMMGTMDMFDSTSTGNKTMMRTHKASSDNGDPDCVTDSHVNAFMTQALARRFPGLRALKRHQIEEIILQQRRSTAAHVPHEPRAPGRATHDRIATLVLADGTTERQWAAYLRAQKGRKEVQIVAHAKDAGPEEGRVPQRENPVWQWAGEVCPGTKEWRPSAAIGARTAVARPPCERFVTDTQHESPFARKLEAQRAHKHAQQAAWLHGDMKYSNWAGARDAVRCKATLLSKDGDALTDDSNAARSLVGGLKSRKGALAPTATLPADGDGDFTAMFS